MARKHSNLLNRIAISRRISAWKARNVRNAAGHETTADSAVKHDAKHQLYAPWGKDVLRLPEDPVMLSVALAELLSVGYDGYLYHDEKFKEPAGKVREVLKGIPFKH